MKYRVLIVAFVLTPCFLLMTSVSGRAEKRLGTPEDNKTTAKVEKVNSVTPMTEAAIPAAADTTTPILEPLKFAPADNTDSKTAKEATDYMVPWKSINGGGGTASTATHKVAVSIGQTVIGSSTTATHRAGIGYWYGITGACDCGVPGDMNCDGSIQPIDVTLLVNWVYRSRNDICNAPNCPYPTGDLNCSGSFQPIDVVLIINLVYRSRNDICDGCAL